jgi:hypothetical protein
MTKTWNRRTALAAAMGILTTLAGAGKAWALPAGGKPTVEVWKSPTCGCCKDWITHMEAAGFHVRVHDSGNTTMRMRLGLPQRLGSCHTALVGGYVVEGHVPAQDVQRLLAEKPAALGLAVPGMPIGSPGMDGPEYGGRREPYEVLLVSGRGDAATTRVWRAVR